MDIHWFGNQLENNSLLTEDFRKPSHKRLVLNMETYSQTDNTNARSLQNRSNVLFWNADTAPSDTELRAASRKRWEESNVQEFTEAPKKTAGLEDYEVAGIAQDPDGAEIPRHGWIANPFKKGEVVPSPENPLRNQLLAMKNSPSFKIAQNYLEHIGMKEKMRC